MKPFEKGSNLGKFKNDVTLRRLYVYSLPPNMTNDSLFELFSEFGTVEDAYIIFDTATKKSKLFGYVIFETTEEAQQVIQRKFIKFNKRKIWVKLHEKPGLQPVLESCLSAGSGSRTLGSDSNQSINNPSSSLTTNVSRDRNTDAHPNES